MLENLPLAFFNAGIAILFYQNTCFVMINHVNYKNV